MDKTILNIQGMHCDGCIQVVQHILEQTPGVHGCTVSLDEQRASIAHEPYVVSAGALAEALTAAGYTATIITGH